MLRSVLASLVLLGCFCPCSGLLEKLSPPPVTPPEGATAEEPDGDLEQVPQADWVRLSGTATTQAVKISSLEPDATGCSWQLVTMPSGDKQELARLPGGCAGFSDVSFSADGQKAVLHGAGWAYEVILSTGVATSLPPFRAGKGERIGYDSSGALLAIQETQFEQKSEGDLHYFEVEGGKRVEFKTEEGAIDYAYCPLLKVGGDQWVPVGDLICASFEGQTEWDMLNSTIVHLQWKSLHQETDDFGAEILEKQATPELTTLRPGETGLRWGEIRTPASVVFEMDYLEGPIPLGAAHIWVGDRFQPLPGLEGATGMHLSQKGTWILASEGGKASGLYDTGTGERKWVSPLNEALFWPDEVPVPAKRSAEAPVEVAPATEEPARTGERPRDRANKPLAPSAAPPVATPPPPPPPEEDETLDGTEPLPEAPEERDLPRNRNGGRKRPRNR